MQPFDKHQANVGELESCGSDLLATVGESVANGQTTLGAYRPAIGNWSGMCAPEIEAAPGPFEAGAAQTRGALAWAAVVARYWGTQVKAFNDRVDAIVAELQAAGPHYGATGSNGDPPTDAQVDAARQAKTAAAKRQWWDAYHSHITDGRSRAASMLRQGPTAGNLREAVEAGALGAPGGSPLGDVWTALRANLIPPGGELGLLGLGLWGASRGMSGLGAASNWMRYARYGVYVRGHWRRIPSGGRTWVDPYWRSRPGTTGPRGGWTTAGKWAGRAGTVVAFGTSALNQWAADSGRTDLSTTDRVARAGTRGALVAGGALAGAKGGAVAGAAIGTAIAPGVGTAIGGAVGGLVGGAVGAGAANWVGDHVVEGVDEVVDAVGDGAGWVGDRASDAGEALSDVGSALNPLD